MTKTTSVIFILMLAGALATGSTPSTVLSAAPRPEIPAASVQELDTALASGRWLIVEFGGEHCIPCKAMQPILQDLQTALGNKVKIQNFWIQKDPETARRFRIMVMPTQVVFNQKGEEVLRHQGVFPAEEFHAALKQAGLL